MRSLYAVLCGINEYQHPVTPLNGCIADVQAVEKYLETQKDQFKPEIVKLLNAKATKQAILQAFESALKNAKEDDVVFLYFSGHGTRETADPVFAEIEQDEGLETFVNYDGITFNGRRYEYNLLSDKEIHYAMHTGAGKGAHVVFMVDSCHSGGITRNMLDPSGTGNALERRYEVVERISNMAPMRRWENFTFGAKIPRETVEEKGWLTVVPQRSHIAMSACQNDESAYEVNGHGVFTTNLLKVLQHARGEVTYRSLQAKVRQYVRNQFAQTPEVYSTRGNVNDLLLTFLDRTGKRGKFSAVCFHKKGKGWAIDLGSAHGVRSNSGPVKVSVNGREFEADIGTLKSDHTFIEFGRGVPGEMNVDKQYDAQLVNYLNGSTAFIIDPGMDNQIYSRLSEYLQDRIKGGTLPYSMTTKFSEAQYMITAGGGCLTIRQCGGRFFPVFSVQNNTSGFDRLSDAMGHIAKWEFVRTYENPDIVLEDIYPVNVNFEYIHPNGSRKLLEYSKESLVLPFVKGASLRISVENSSEFKYYCALLYLSNTFQATAGLLDGKVVGLNAGEKAWVFNGQSLPLTLEDHVREFRIPESVSFLKLIANKDQFSADAMEMDALPAPSKDGCSEKEGEGTRGLEMPSTRRVEQIPWFTRTIALKVTNPDV